MMRARGLVCRLVMASMFAPAMIFAGGHGRSKIKEYHDFLLPFQGKEISIIDNTSGTEQFVNGDTRQSYVLTLKEVQSDYLIVVRKTENDKRSFLDPLSIIHRILHKFGNQPYIRIVLEMY